MTQIDPSEEQIYSAVEAWLDLVAAGEFDAAFRATRHDPYYGWTAELIQQVINGYGSPTPHSKGPFRATSRVNASGNGPHREIFPVEPGSDDVFIVSHDIPLNGKWSDLSVTFAVGRQLPLLTLQEIHVM